MSIETQKKPYNQGALTEFLGSTLGWAFSAEQRTENARMSAQYEAEQRDKKIAKPVFPDALDTATLDQYFLSLKDKVKPLGGRFLAWDLEKEMCELQTSPRINQEGWYEKFREQGVGFTDAEEVEFFTTFQNRMNTRYGDAVPEVLFCGLPWKFNFVEALKAEPGKGTLGIIKEAIQKEAERKRSNQGPVRWEYLITIQDAIRREQVQQIVEAYVANPTAENTALFKKMSEKPQYAGLLLTLVDEQRTSRLTSVAKEGTLNTLLAKHVGWLEADSDSSIEGKRLVAIHEELKNDAILADNTTLGKVIEILDFADFSLNHSTVDKVKYVYLKFFSLSGSESKRDIQLLWRQEMVMRLAKLYQEVVLAAKAQSTPAVFEDSEREQMGYYGVMVKQFVELALSAFNAQMDDRAYLLTLDEVVRVTQTQAVFELFGKGDERKVAKAVSLQHEAKPFYRRLK